MLKITISRIWQGRIIAVLIFVIISIGILGIYALHKSPGLVLGPEFPVSPKEYDLHKIEELELDPAFFLRLPEFFTLKEEAQWWRIQEKVYDLLHKNSSVSVEFTWRNGVAENVEAAVGFPTLSDVIKKTGLIYLAALIYMISAVSVFRKHHSTAGSMLTFFLLSGSLYLVSSTPVANREITLYSPHLKMLIGAIWISAGGMITLVHFALVFPGPKEILRKFSAIPYIFYGYFLLTVILYFSKLIAFGSTFPFLCFWTFVMIGAFIHSLVKEKDTFLRKQISLSFLAPLVMGAIFILLNILPGLLGTAPIDFTYFALFSLIIPFALPSAMDNLRLYEQRIEIEKNSQREKERICQEIHDNLANDLTSIRFLSEVAEQSLSKEAEKVRGTIKTIKNTALKNIEQLRDFIWAIDLEEETLDDLYSHFKSYTTRLFTPLNIEIEFKPLSLTKTLHLDTFFRFNLFNIYKEAITNIIKHSKAERVEVELSLNDKVLEMKVSDDGVGFSSGSGHTASYGLRNMKNRAADIGGVIKISSIKGKGTEVHFILHHTL